jgi:hypothetical protein
MSIGMRAVQIKSSEAADLSTKPGRQQRQGQQQHMRQGCQVPWPSKSITNRAQHSKQSQWCLHASTVDAGQSLLMNCAQAPAPLQLIDLAAPESFVCVSGSKSELHAGQHFGPGDTTVLSSCYFALVLSAALSKQTVLSCADSITA